MKTTANSQIGTLRWLFVVPALMVVLGGSAAFLVEYPVEIEMTAGTISTSVTVIQDSLERTVETGAPLTLLPDSIVRVEEAASVTFTLTDDHDASVTIVGPAEFSYEQGEKTGTAAHHLNRRKLDYRVVFGQSSGKVYYDFSHATPPFEEWEIVLHLPDGTYRPESPCWNIAIVNGISQVLQLECAGR